MHSFSSTTAFYTFQPPQHFSGAEYLKRATGSMKGFNMQWTWSSSSVFRDVAIALSIFRNSLPILGCSLTAKRAGHLIVNEWSIGEWCLPPRLSFVV
jgi:hypothetical protein